MHIWHSMLSLKESQIVLQAIPQSNILDLPEELLHEIISFLYNDNGRFIRDLIPVSVSCVRLREATAPFLFRTLHVRLTQRYVDRRTFNILLNCHLSPHTFAGHVRHIVQDDSYCFRESNCEDLRLSNELVRLLTKQALQAMVSLTTIR